DEARRNATLQVRIASEALLVTHPETAEVLADDALDDLGRQTAADGGRTHAHFRGTRRVRAAQTPVTRAETLTRPGAGTVAEGPDIAETDTFASAAATFTDTRETETAGAECVADFVAPHVAASADLVGAERRVAPPRSRRRVRIARRARVEEADHSELHRLAQRSLASNVRIRIVLRPLHRVPLVRSLGGRIPHGTLLTFGARPGAAFLVVRVLLNDLGFLFLLLTLRGNIEVLLHEVEPILVEILVVRETERRNEEGHRGDEPGVHQERQPEVRGNGPIERGADTLFDRLARVDGRNLEHEPTELDARACTARQSQLVPASNLRSRLRAWPHLFEAHSRLAWDLDVARRARRDHQRDGHAVSHDHRKAGRPDPLARDEEVA